MWFCTPNICFLAALKFVFCPFACFSCDLISYNRQLEFVQKNYRQPNIGMGQLCWTYYEKYHRKCATSMLIMQGSGYLQEIVHSLSGAGTVEYHIYRHYCPLYIIIIIIIFMELSARKCLKWGGIVSTGRLLIRGNKPRLYRGTCSEKGLLTQGSSTVHWDFF